MIQGHELKGGIDRGNQGTRWKGAKGENWDNCNSIINKTYLKKERKKIKLGSTCSSTRKQFRCVSPIASTMEFITLQRKSNSITLNWVVV